MLKKKLNQCQFPYKLYVDDDHQVIYITDSINCRENSYTSLSRPVLNGFLVLSFHPSKLKKKKLIYSLTDRTSMNYR